MKLSKTVMASAMALTLVTFGAQAANQGQGVVNFKGTVINAPCGIAPESADQSIDFGQLSQAHLIAEGTSPIQDLNIKLINCVVDPAAVKSVKVAFTGTTIAGQLSELGTSGNTGTAVVVSEQGSKAGVKFDGTAGAATSLSTGDTTLRYSTWVKKATGGTVTEGEFAAVANFNLSYE